MTDAKHTPAPWDDGKTVIVKGLTFIASAHFETAEGEANTRLIAAAPDLAETLRWVRANYASGPTAEINARIDAVLAKVEA